jgi:signal transduction histidine kinase
MTRSRLRVLAVIPVAATAVLATADLYLHILPAASVSQSTRYSSGVTDLISPVVLIMLAVVGGVVARRQPRNPIGWLFGAAAVVQMLSLVMDQYALVGLSSALSSRTAQSLPGAPVANVISTWIWEVTVTLLVIYPLLLFPTGRLLSKRWRPVAWAVAPVVAVNGLARTFAPGELSNARILMDNPLALHGAAGGVIKPLFALVLLLPIAAVLGVIALILRYRRGSGVEREQLKWILFAMAVYATTFVVHTAFKVVDINLQVLGDISMLGLLGVPVAASVAILKYRLYDIDLVISRALVYGSLAVFITAVYVGIVVGIGTLVGSGAQPNLLLSIVATAVVAVAFQPVRERLQKVANRLVYGKRSTPYEVLSKFSERVSETYAADEALPRMAQVLAEGTGAELAQVWLRQGESLRAAASWPEGAVATMALAAGADSMPEIPDVALAVPVRHQGELLGALTVTKRTGETLTPVEEKLLDDLAHQAGLVLKNVGLTTELLRRLEDLRASRQRLVAAQDGERRKLERNLHDGAQQNLVALKIKLGLAESVAAKDPGKARDLIGQLMVDADEALQTLRDLARGIYPPLLADQGLGAALASQARKATISVSVEADGIARYSPDVEAAVYFCCLEALQNVQKYGAADDATVRLSVSNGYLQFEVQDHGKGFDPASTQKGSGLQNMEDRLDAMNGSIVLTSAPGSGTIVAGRLPALRTVAT